MGMDLRSALNAARKPGNSVVVEVTYRLKRVLLYYIDGHLSYAKIFTAAGEEITGRDALNKIMTFGDNYQSVDLHRLEVDELFRITASPDAFEEKRTGYEQLKTFFFYITPEEVALLTCLTFNQNDIPAKHLPWKEAIFDLWENGVVEFNGFFVHLPSSKRHLVKRLLIEHLKRCLRRRDLKEVEELKRNWLSPGMREFLTKEGFTLLNKEMPKELLEGIRDFSVPKKEELMEKYNISKPDLEDIRRMLEEE